MIERVAKKMIAWQIKKKYLPEKEKELYTYAYGLLIGQGVNIIIACLLALALHSFIPVFHFLLFYIPLRSYAGGYHAKSYTICTLFSNALVLLICLINKIVPGESILSINLLGSGVCGTMIFFLSPVQDVYKPLEKIEKDCYSKRSRAIWFGETACWIVCYWLGFRDISLAITTGHFILAVLLGIGSIKNYYQVTVQNPPKSFN